MITARSFVMMLALLLVTGGWLTGADTKDKIKGTLPANWGKLGLTDDQKQKVYKVQAEYKDKIADLEKQIKELKEKERGEMEKVLTDEQKKRLKEILGSKAPDDKKEDKKEKDEKKQE